MIKFINTWKKLDLDCDSIPLKIKVNILPQGYPTPVKGYVGGFFNTCLCKTVWCDIFLDNKCILQRNNTI